MRSTVPFRVSSRVADVSKADQCRLVALTAPGTRVGLAPPADCPTPARARASLSTSHRTPRLRALATFARNRKIQQSQLGMPHKTLLVGQRDALMMQRWPERRAVRVDGGAERVP